MSSHTYAIATANNLIYEELATAFKEAERLLKLVEREHIAEGLDIPSINELRYVAYHMIEVLSLASDEASQLEAIRKAIRHCQRASFDAIELGLISVLESIAEFKSDYKKVSLTTVLPDIVEIFRDVEQHKDILNTNDEHKHEKYIQAENSYTKLLAISNKLEAAREELNKLNPTTWSSLVTKILAFVGAVGLVVTVVKDGSELMDRYTKKEETKVVQKATPSSIQSATVQ